MTYGQDYQDACVKELLPLVGKKITAVIRDEDGNFGITVGGPTTGFDLWIMADPEGNGPGFPDVCKPLEG